jgi:leucyl aminopeptidase
VTENAPLLAPNEPGVHLPVWLVTESGLADWLARHDPATVEWLGAQRFRAERNRLLAWPAADGKLAGAVFGLGPIATVESLSIWQGAALADRLPAGRWACQTALSHEPASRLALGFALGAYRFERYRGVKSPAAAQLVMPAGADAAGVRLQWRALTRARDLINTPANNLGPAELTDEVQSLAAEFGAQLRIVRGPDLQRDYPMIAMVGQGSAREPLLLDLTWGAADAPRVSLVGKGVCFDSGGLDLKPSAAMLLMKKDMGGAACALATAEMLMASKAPVRLRLLIAAVENSVSGNAYRPGDVLRSRKGLTVEIGNTDAEGRLVLADALADADCESPALLVDFATLTGAARTALGPELPAAFSPDRALLAELVAAGDASDDPVWPLPLWMSYDDDIASKVADISNVASHAFAGATIGALFLKRFVTATTCWIHLDLYAWNARERPGRPVGAEAQCARAVLRLIRARFG